MELYFERMANSYEVASIHEFHGQPHHQQSSALQFPGNGPFVRTKQASGLAFTQRNPCTCFVTKPSLLSSSERTPVRYGRGRNTDPCAGGRRAAVSKENSAGGPAHGFDSDKPAARSVSCNTENDQLSVSETASSDHKQTTRQFMHHASNCQDETAHLQLPSRVPLATAEPFLRSGIISFLYPPFISALHHIT